MNDSFDQQVEEVKDDHFEIQQESPRQNIRNQLESQGIDNPLMSIQARSEMLPPRPGTSNSEQVSESNYQKSSNTTSFNLRDYNQKRLQGKSGVYDRRLNSSAHNQSDVNTSQGNENSPLKEKEQEVEEETQGESNYSDQINSEIIESKMGNINISLFWEEKIVMIIRFFQFYGYLMMICYEVWPFQSRRVWSGLFFFFTGSFQFMISADQYYSVIQSMRLSGFNLIGYVIFLVLVITVSFCTVLFSRIYFGTIKQRNKIMNSKFGFQFQKLCILPKCKSNGQSMKYGFWFLEIIYFPLFMNLIEYSTCQYYSSKEAIQVAKCNLETNQYVAMLFTALLTFLVAFGYNLILALHLYREKVSNLLHEEYLVKKEIEYALGISEMWSTRFFYTFSSFKGEVVKMYHRVIFNGLQFVLMIVHASMPESQAKIGITVGLMTLFVFYIIATRPYRSFNSNVLIFMLSCTIVVTSFLLLLKKGGLKSALFVDNYFYGLLIVVNAIFWVSIAAFLILIILTKSKWVTTRESVLKAISGQDIAIFYIKKAKKFQKKVVKSKRFETKESKLLNHYLKTLTDQFNMLRDRQPIILDALLEIIEQLKEMKRNYEENKFLYNYDYREELSGLVKSRYRIYETRELS